MTAGRCECACRGCRTYCLDTQPADGRDAHHTRILLALDRSIAATCRARGVSACNGVADDEPCEVGTLHTRAAEFAVALADVLAEPLGKSTTDRAHIDHAHSTLDRLLLEVTDVLAGKPRLS